jgi:hypothetical protein
MKDMSSSPCPICIDRGTLHDIIVWASSHYTSLNYPYGREASGWYSWTRPVRPFNSSCCLRLCQATDKDATSSGLNGAHSSRLAPCVELGDVERVHFSHPIDPRGALGHVHVPRLRNPIDIFTLDLNDKFSKFRIKNTFWELMNLDVGALF